MKQGLVLLVKFSIQITSLLPISKVGYQRLPDVFNKPSDCPLDEGFFFL